MRTWSIFPQCNNLLVCALFLVVPFFTFSTHAPISPHPDGVQCHLPNLLGERISEETPKFIEFACSPIDGRYDKCTKLGGIGNTLIMFPAVYLAAMLSGRQIIIHDNSGLGNWCRALKCDFPFTSAMEELFTDLKTVKHVVSLTQNDFAYKLRKNTSIPDSIIGFRGMDVYATKWFHYAGPYASACVEHITGNLKFRHINHLSAIMKTDISVEVFTTTPLTQNNVYTTILHYTTASCMLSVIPYHAGNQSPLFYM